MQRCVRSNESAPLWTCLSSFSAGPRPRLQRHRLLLRERRRHRPAPPPEEVARRGARRPRAAEGPGGHANGGGGSDGREGVWGEISLRARSFGLRLRTAACVYAHGNSPSRPSLNPPPQRSLTKAAGSACLLAHWLLFVVVVSWRALRLEHGALADGEQAGVLLAALLVSVLAIVPTVVLTYQDRSQAEEGTAGDKEEKRAEGLGLPDVTLCEEALAREVLAEMATALPSGATATPETCSESDWKDLKACDQDVPEDTDATSTPPSTWEWRVVFV